jgi:hypothetical protein
VVVVVVVVVMVGSCALTWLGLFWVLLDLYESCVFCIFSS